MVSVEPTVPVEFQPFVDGVRLKRRSPAVPRERNGGVCIALAGNFSQGGDTYYFDISDCPWALGSIASIVSLVLYWCDKKK